MKQSAANLVKLEKHGAKVFYFYHTLLQYARRGGRFSIKHFCNVQKMSHTTFYTYADTLWQYGLLDVLTSNSCRTYVLHTSIPSGELTKIRQGSFREHCTSKKQNRQYASYIKIASNTFQNNNHKTTNNCQNDNRRTYQKKKPLNPKAVENQSSKGYSFGRKHQNDNPSNYSIFKDTYKNKKRDINNIYVVVTREKTSKNIPGNQEKAEANIADLNCYQEKMAQIAALAKKHLGTDLTRSCLVALSKWPLEYIEEKMELASRTYTPIQNIDGWLIAACKRDFRPNPVCNSPKKRQYTSRKNKAYEKMLKEIAELNEKYKEIYMAAGIEDYQTCYYLPYNPYYEYSEWKKSVEDAIADKLNEKYKDIYLS